MVDATSNDSIFQLLLEQSDQPDQVSAELAENLRLEWAEREALSRITNIDLAHEIMMDRWISLAERGPVPIGREAIRSDYRLKTLIPASRTELERSFVLPGNEILDFPITGEVAGSFCELLFLVTMITTTYPEATPWGTTGTVTEDDWLPGEVIVRITGDPYSPEVQHLVANAKTWWTGKTQRVPVRRGPKETPIDWDRVQAIASEMKAGLVESGRIARLPERTVTDRDVWDEVKFDVLLSWDGFRKRLQRARAEGRIPSKWS